jgi:ATP-dependent helicase/nuclease subunit B
MEALDTSKRELDALDFGSLVHHVLEVFGLDEEARELNKPEAIHQFLSNQLKQQVRERYGRTPPLPVQVQSQIAERRLYAAAVAQAEEHAKGWRIESTEHQFERKLEGMEIRGRIDRVERHEATGAVRVLDYKSSTKANPPFASHTATCNAETPDYEVFDATIKGRAKERRWVDLQLPLYAWALKHEADSDLQLGYFNLPALGADTGVQLLEPYTPELQQHAMDCASAIVAKVKAQEFWPPTDKPKYDEFKSILFDQPEVTAEPPQMERVT